MSAYLDHLPAIYRQSETLRSYLAEYEQVLAALEREIESLPRCFDPDEAETGFLDWLAGWVGLTLRADLPESARRSLIGNAVHLYRRRGTKEGLEKLLEFAGLNATIDEDTGFRLGASRLGPSEGQAPLDARLFYFRVVVVVTGFDTTKYPAIERLVRAIADPEKPAHAYYDVVLVTPELQIGETSAIGVNTLIRKSTTEENR